MTLESLVAGLAGGLVATYMFPRKRPDGSPAPRGKRRYCVLAASVLVGMCAAVYLGPMTAAWVNMGWIEDDVEVRAFSFLWGAGAQAGLLASAIRALRRMIDAVKPTTRS